MATITSTTAILRAQEATAATATYWADAYAATAQDVASGASVREIADAWKAARITPANKDSVGDFEDASRLSVYGTDYLAAIAEVFGEGTLKPAHYLTMKARKARGRTYVRAVLTTLEDKIAAIEDLDAAAVIAAIVKAVRTLDAAKKEAKPDPVEDSATGDDTTENADAATGDDGERTPDDMLAALAGPTVALRGLIESGAEYDADKMTAWLREVSAIARAHKAMQAHAA